MKSAQRYENSWHLKIFLFYDFSILVGSHLGNIPVKFESHWLNGSGGVSFQNKLLTTRTTHDLASTLLFESVTQKPFDIVSQNLAQI